MSQAENNKRIAKNSIYMSIRMVIVLCITLYTTRAILDVLGVEDYGIYNVVCGFVSMLAFLNTSMSNGIQRFFNFEYGKNGETGANRVYNTALIIQSLLAIVILVLAESFGLWYMYEKMVIPADRFVAAQWIFQLSLVSFLFIIMQAPYTAAVMAHEKMDFYAIVSVLDAILKLGIVFAIPLLDGDGLIIYGILLSLISVLNFILYYVYCKKNFNEIKFHIIFDRSLFRSMLGFSGWNVFGSFAIMMKEQGINLVLNLFFGPIVNAARGVASQVNGGIHSFVSNITTPVRPQVVQSFAKGDLTRSLNLTYSVCKLSCLFFYMLALPICLEISFILNVWLGSNIPAHSDTFVIIVLATAFTSNLHAAVSNLVHATGKMKAFQLYTSAIKLCSVPIAYYSVILFELPEIALTIVWIVDIVAHGVGCWTLSKITVFPLKDYVFKVILPILSVVVLTTIPVVFIHCLIDNNVARFISVITASVLSIALIGYKYGLNITEKQLFQSIIKSVINKFR